MFGATRQRSSTYEDSFSCNHPIRPVIQSNFPLMLTYNVIFSVRAMLSGRDDRQVLFLSDKSRQENNAVKEIGLTYILSKHKNVR